MTIRIGINVFVFLLVMLSGNAVFAGDDSSEKMIDCASESHDLIKGYKIYDNKKSISIFLCDGSVVIPDKDKEQESLSNPIISNNGKTIGLGLLKNYTSCCFLCSKLLYLKII
jgi:hypothetical protein